MNSQQLIHITVIIRSVCTTSSTATPVISALPATVNQIVPFALIDVEPLPVVIAPILIFLVRCLDLKQIRDAVHSNLLPLRDLQYPQRVRTGESLRPIRKFPLVAWIHTVRRLVRLVLRRRCIPGVRNIQPQSFQPPDLAGPNENRFDILGRDLAIFPEVEIFDVSESVKLIPKEAVGDKRAAEGEGDEFRETREKTVEVGMCVNAGFDPQDSEGIGRECCECGTTVAGGPVYEMEFDEGRELGKKALAGLELGACVFEYPDPSMASGAFRNGSGGGS